MEDAKEKKSVKISLKQLLIIIFIIIAIILLIFLIEIATTNKNISRHKLNKIEKETGISIDTSKEPNEEIEIVPTLLDELKLNGAWCGTFQLVWNDMQNEVIKKDIIFNKQIKIVENLNEQTFTTKHLSDSYYYKKFGEKSPELKEEIQKGIKDKFNEESEILDSINWEKSTSEDIKKYVFYAMLYREFNFENLFDTFNNGKFYGMSDTYDDIKYFGIDKNSNSKLYSQVDVLYYNSKSDFAVILNTKENDELILVRGDNGATYTDIYNNMVEKTEQFDGKIEFGENDFLKVPNLKFNVLKEYDELKTDGTDRDKFFKDYQENDCHIENAIQTIKMELDESGGKVKSEALIDMQVDTTALAEKKEEVEKRYFYFDHGFTIFIKEQGKDVPYFAANIDNIELFQEKDPVTNMNGEVYPYSEENI